MVTKNEDDASDLPKKRELGISKGEFELTDAFFEPMSESELAEWESGDL